MAYEGELVKMENGRWARFTRCNSYITEPGLEALPVLVAVECDESYQPALEAAQADDTLVPSSLRLQRKRLDWSHEAQAQLERRAAL